MKNLKSFHKKLIKESDNENDYSIVETVNKDLAKEDALTLVSEFVKDVKKKFPNKQDKLEILKDISKTLEFYINEIENTTSSIDVMTVSPGPMDFDEVSSEFKNEEDTEDEYFGER